MNIFLIKFQKYLSAQEQMDNKQFYVNNNYTKEITECFV